MTCSSFPVSRCGAPSISVTSVPLVPPSARSAALRAPRAVAGACAGGRMRASAPTTWTVAFGVPEKWMAFRILAKGNVFPHPRKNECPSAFPQKAMAFRIPGKTDALPHSHKRRWLSASPENGCPYAYLQTANGLPNPPHPRRGRCPHRPAAPAPADLQASGSEKRSRGNATTTPTRPAPSATGRQFQKLQKSIACPKAGQNRRLHRSADSRQRGGPLHRSAPKRFFSSTGRGAFSFWRNQKENGGRTPVGTAPCGSRNPPWPPSGGPHLPGRRITAPTVLPGACPTGPMRASAPTGAPFTPAGRCGPADNL